jgi:hypothetical protein
LTLQLPDETAMILLHFLRIRCDFPHTTSRRADQTGQTSSWKSGLPQTLKIQSDQMFFKRMNNQSFDQPIYSLSIPLKVPAAPWQIEFNPRPLPGLTRCIHNSTGRALTGRA